jgi:cobyrinic acid a,c-diamide synthase
MAGLLPVETSFALPTRELGYRSIEAETPTLLGPAGARFRGHTFHYAQETRNDAPRLFRAADALGRDRGSQGAVMGGVMGSFLHLVDCASPPAPASASSLARPAISL